MILLSIRLLPHPVAVLIIIMVVIDIYLLYRVIKNWWGKKKTAEEAPKLKVIRYDATKQCGLFCRCSCPFPFSINLDAWIAFNIVGCPRCGTEYNYSDYREAVQKAIGDSKNG